MKIIHLLYCNFVINCVKSYSLSYCLVSHSSGRDSNMALTPVLGLVFELLSPPLLPLWENRSRSWSVPIVSKWLFSPLITVLAVWTLNFCNLEYKKNNMNGVLNSIYPILKNNYKCVCGLNICLAWHISLSAKFFYCQSTL